MEREKEVINLETQVTPDESKQSQIINAVESGDFSLPSKEAGTDTLPEEKREEFLEKLRQDEVDEKQVSDFLKNLPTPIEEQDKSLNILVEMYDEIEKNDDLRKMISKITRGTEKHSKEVTPRDLQVFLATYPSPMAFENDMNRFFEKIENKYSAEYRDKLKNSLELDKFTHTVYGKRQEYYEQYKILKEQAKNKVETTQQPQESKQVEAEPMNLEQELKTEFRNIFQNLQNEGEEINENILENANYHNLRNNNPNIRELAKKIRSIEGTDPDSLIEKFTTLEEETLKELTG